VFERRAGEGGERIVEFAVELDARSRGDREAVDVGGVRLRLLEPAAS
jgi:hypothetical protein